MEFVVSSLTACWQAVSPLRALLPSYCALLPGLEIGRRKYTVLKLLAEGGYSFVYLVQDQEPDPDSGLRRQYAVKKVLAVTTEQLAEAKQEIDLMTQLTHPNILPVLASAITTAPSQEGGLQHVVYMLFPLYQEGSAFDVVTSLAQEGRELPWQDALNIFYQTCRAVQVMHNLQPAIAHRDIKPHNVLLQHRKSSRAQRTAALDQAEEAESLQQSHPGMDGGTYQAVLMDFGSARAARVAVHNRTAALMLQEQAEKLCSAPYRAPELFDVASSCTVDERTDVWSLGCLLFFLLYGVSPFERVLGEAGGSLALAVINGSLSFPSPDRRPDALKALIRACLSTDPQTRPFVGELLTRIEDLISRT